MGFSERIDTILNRTELNRTELNQTGISLHYEDLTGTDVIKLYEEEHLSGTGHTNYSPLLQHAESLMPEVVKTTSDFCRDMYV